MVQPLETSIVRSIDVHEGEAVHAGQVLARLDPTFAAADLGASAAQVSSLQAQVGAHAGGGGRQAVQLLPGSIPNLSLAGGDLRPAQGRIRLQAGELPAEGRQPVATIARANSDAAGYRDRLAVAQSVEQMRKQLEKLQVGSQLNTLAAMDSRAEMAAQPGQCAGTGRRAPSATSPRCSPSATAMSSNGTPTSPTSWPTRTSKLSDARESLNKAQLRRQLVELRADRDATVLTVAKVSVGSVLQSGQQFITLVPSDAPLEVEANIAGRDDGYVHVGDPVAIKFDTFPFTQYGLAYGTVRIISAGQLQCAGGPAQSQPAGAVPMPASSGEPYYRARVAIDRVALHDVPASFRLMPGMPVTADVKVGKRTVLQYLLQRVLPVTQEAMREP